MPIAPRESLPYSLARFSQSVKRICEPVVRAIRFSKILNRSSDSLDEAWCQQLNGNVPVFVYQMGKVASTSIYRSLCSQYDGCVFHGHYFGPNHSNARIRALYEYKKTSTAPLKIISLVRDPISRNVSAFFQNFKRDTGMEIEHCGKTMLELRDMFLTNYPHEIPWVWFDNNLRKHFGIDVYAQPFPQEGYLRIGGSPTELLLMRHDLADSVKEQLVEEFVGLDSFRIERSNVSAEKNYHEYIEEFKALKMPLWYLYRVCSSKYTKHFYGDQIGQIVATWQEEDRKAA